jgi:predicted nucleic acid-binding protein
VFTEEAGAGRVVELWDASDRVFCLALGYLELRAVIARRLATGNADRARCALDETWDEVEEVAVDDALIMRASIVVDTHRLRTIDALHLSAALALGDPELVLATWDDELRSAAQAVGLATAP